MWPLSPWAAAAHFFGYTNVSKIWREERKYQRVLEWEKYQRVLESEEKY